MREKNFICPEYLEFSLKIMIRATEISPAGTRHKELVGRVLGPNS